ncbi:MAG: beta-ketoacyl-ACP synthase II [Terriglobales bacterium]
MQGVNSTRPNHGNGNGARSPRVIELRRVAVTGVGLLCSLGLTTEEAWSGILAGKSGARRITRFDTRDFQTKIAAEVQGFDPAQYLERKDLKRMARFIQFAIAASDMAMRQSGLKITCCSAERVGVCVGSGVGGLEILEREHAKLLGRGPGRVSAFLIPSMIVNLASGFISLRTGARGPNLASATACATGTHSIGDSHRLIQMGQVDAMICGASEAAITPLLVGGFSAMRALSTRNDCPEEASRPWDKDRDGFVIGEGAGVLVLEEMEHAKQRGANILAEIVGYAATADAYHFTSVPRDGNGALRAMRNAIQDADIRPQEIQYVSAHATSTGLGDRAESVAIEKLFGEHAHKVAVSSTKSMTGHLLGAAGAFGAGVTVLALHHQVVPPTANLTTPGDGCNLDYVPGRARPMLLQHAISNSFGFGGTNASLVFRHYQNGLS